MTHVPYRGSAPLITDLLGGQVNVAMDFMPTYLPLVASGKVRALAVTTSQRVAQLPDVPTVQEAGFKGFEATAWYAIVAPTGTPPDIVSKVNKCGERLPEERQGQDHHRAKLAARCWRISGGPQGVHRRRTRQMASRDRGRKDHDVSIDDWY